MMLEHIESKKDYCTEKKFEDAGKEPCEYERRLHDPCVFCSHLRRDRALRIWRNYHHSLFTK